MDHVLFISRFKFKFIENKLRNANKNCFEIILKGTLNEVQLI